VQGKVDRLIESKGQGHGRKRFFYEWTFGFIVDDAGVERFFHRSELRPGAVVKAGDQVTFEPATGPKGPSAKSVSPRNRGENAK
jgi:cold shock CspA family protein